MRDRARNHFAQHDSPIPEDSLARVTSAGQQVDMPAHQGMADGQYTFLRQAGISDATLTNAEAQARRCGAAVHEVLMSAGHVSDMAYASALAGSLGLPMAGWDAVFEEAKPDNGEFWLQMGMPAYMHGQAYRVLCAEDKAPVALCEQVAALQARGLNVALSPRRCLDAALARSLQAERIDHAISGLARQQPVSSAAGSIWIWQVIAAAIAVGLLVGGFSILPQDTMAALSGVIAIPFLGVTVLRTLALREVIASPRRQLRRAGGTGEAELGELPRYTVLVPLFREVNVLPGLVQSLQALAYPSAKLEILLVLEAIDIETQAGVLALQLPGNFRTILVPDKAPRTKPKALNYALQFARGDYVVVYDAEDRPEPDQLLRALTAFKRGSPQLGCVQAQLNIYNPRASWLTRQFTIEYSALFDAILPALERLRLPVPLGGTSNHFRGLMQQTHLSIKSTGYEKC